MANYKTKAPLFFFNLEHPSLLWEEVVLLLILLHVSQYFFRKGSASRDLLNQSPEIVHQMNGYSDNQSSSLWHRPGNLTRQTGRGLFYLWFLGTLQGLADGTFAHALSQSEVRWCVGPFMDWWILIPGAHRERRLDQIRIFPFPFPFKKIKTRKNQARKTHISAKVCWVISVVITRFTR